LRKGGKNALTRFKAMRALRLSDGPIIHAGLCDGLGSNLNGPSLIRAPEWVPDPLGTYYLYFAHHQGRFIRMAYANVIEGPWQIYSKGVLDVKQTQFAQEDLTLPNIVDDESVSQPINQLLYAHVASPDVHADHDARKIRMYYHGLLANGKQATRLALSRDGLSFSSLSPILGPPYFRVFAYEGYIYAIAWGGALFRARTWSGPFERGPDIFCGPPLVERDLTMRHSAVIRYETNLHIFYSCIGDLPERIWQARIDLDPDWNNWRVHRPSTLLQPELAWEGAELPVQPSKIGPAHGPEHALRDPCIFENHLLYSGAGETAIGLAKLEGLDE